jgi:hypothetical protein
MPFDGDVRAAYATLDADGIALHRVDYDVEANAAALEAVGEPWGPWLAGIVRTARFTPPPAVS